MDKENVIDALLRRASEIILNYKTTATIQVSSFDLVRAKWKTCNRLPIEIGRRTFPSPFNRRPKAEASQQAIQRQQLMSMHKFDFVYIPKKLVF